MTLVVAIGSAILPEVVAGAIGSIGTGLVGGTVLGSGLGAIQGAITGQGAGKGALGGAITGGIGGAAAPFISGLGSMAAQVAGGALAGGAASAAGAAATGKPVGTSAMIGAGLGGALAGINANTGAAGGASTAGGTAAKTAAGAVGQDALKVGNTPLVGDAYSKSLGLGPISEMPAPGTATPATSSTANPLSKIGDAITKMPAGQMVKNIGAIGVAGMADKALNPAAPKQDTSTPTSVPLTVAPQVSGIYQPSSTGGSSPSNPLGGLGNIGFAKGGHVPLKDGAYIIPADVVSALGNGSSKAGAEFLQRLMIQVKHEAVKRQGMGAARAHVA